MATVKTVLLFNDENERQRIVGEFLKSKKRCKTAFVTEIVYEWMQRRSDNSTIIAAASDRGVLQEAEEEIIQKVKQALIADDEFLTKLSYNKEKTSERRELSAQPNTDDENEVLDMDEELLLAGLSMFEAQT